MHATHDGGGGREAAHATENGILRLRRKWRNDAEERFIDAARRIQEGETVVNSDMFLLSVFKKRTKDVNDQIDNIILSCGDPLNYIINIISIIK